MAGVDARAVVDAVASVTGGPAGHHDAVVTSADQEVVANCLWYLSDHRVIDLLERRLERACEVHYAVAVSSGSAALELALVACGVRPGDAVVVPALSFVAAMNAVLHVGAVPVLVDAAPSDLGLDPGGLLKVIEHDVLKASMDVPRRRLAAIVAVHVLGHSCAIAAIAKIAAIHRIPLIEDAAEALGSSSDGRPCGSWGTAAVLSFNYNKIVTGGGGGALLTNDPGIAARSRHLATTARIAHPWLVAHDEPAWNYRMSTMSAALAASQLFRLCRMLTAKRALASAYQAALHGIDGVGFHVEPPGTFSNYWLNTILVPAGDRDAVLTALHERGLMARALFTPMHQLAPYAMYGDRFPVADNVWSRAVCLPSGVVLGEKYI